MNYLQFALDLLLFVVGALVAIMSIHYGYRLGIGAVTAKIQAGLTARSRKDRPTSHDRSQLDTIPEDEIEVPPWVSQEASEQSNKDGPEWDESKAQEV